MKKLSSILLAITISAWASLAQAQTTDNLQNLANNNGSLTIGDKTFSDFSFLANGLTNFNASQIQVTVSIESGTYFLTLGGNISLVAGGLSTADFLLNYDVSASNGVISMIDQSYTGSAQPMGGAFLSIDETVRNRSNQNFVVGNSHLQGDDLSDPAAEAGDNLNLSMPSSNLSITTGINLAVVNGGQVSISELRQSFHQTAIPEPGTTAMLILGVGAVALLFRKKALRAS